MRQISIDEMNAVSGGFVDTITIQGTNSSFGGFGGFGAFGGFGGLSFSYTPGYNPGFGSGGIDQFAGLVDHIDFSALLEEVDDIIVVQAPPRDGDTTAVTTNDPGTHFDPGTGITSIPDEFVNEFTPPDQEEPSDSPLFLRPGERLTTLDGEIIPPTRILPDGTPVYEGVLSGNGDDAVQDEYQGLVVRNENGEGGIVAVITADGRMDPGNSFAGIRGQSGGDGGELRDDTIVIDGVDSSPGTVHDNPTDTTGIINAVTEPEILQQEPLTPSGVIDFGFREYEA